MSDGDSAAISLTPPPQVTVNFGGSAGDLVYDPADDNPPWSGDAIAAFGTQVPSYTACQQAINTHPMDLSVQNLFQGHGYCLQVDQDKVAYARIVSLSAANGSASGEVTLIVTLWQSQNSA